MSVSTSHGDAAVDFRRRALRSTLDFVEGGASSLTWLAGSCHRTSSGEEWWEDTDVEVTAAELAILDLADCAHGARVVGAAPADTVVVTAHVDKVTMATEVVSAARGARRSEHTFAYGTLVWEPRTELGAYARRMAHFICRPHEVATHLESWVLQLCAPPAASRFGAVCPSVSDLRDRAGERIGFEPYASAQLLDRLVPYFLGQGERGHRSGLFGCSGQHGVRLVDSRSFRALDQAPFDDLGTDVQDLVVWGDDTARPLSQETGRVFRTSHRHFAEAGPAGLVLEGGVDPAGDAPRAVVTRVHQLRTGGSFESPTIRCVLGVRIDASEFVTVPCEIGIDRFLSGIVGVGSERFPFPFKSRVLGSSVVAEMGAFL